MPLTVANLTVVDNTALTQYSLEITSSGIVSLPINEAGKLIELHQMLFSMDSGAARVKLAQYNNLGYLMLRGGGVTASFSNFSNAPFVFPGVGEHLYVDGLGTNTKMVITVWYRLIDAP